MYVWICPDMESQVYLEKVNSLREDKAYSLKTRWKIISHASVLITLITCVKQTWNVNRWLHINPRDRNRPAAHWIAITRFSNNPCCKDKSDQNSICKGLGAGLSCNWLFSRMVMSHGLVRLSTENSGLCISFGKFSNSLHLEKHCILISFIPAQRHILGGYVASHMLIILLRGNKLMKMYCYN